VAKRAERIDSRAVRPTGRAGGSQEFNPDYSYVRTDLRRIAFLAGVFFFLLIVIRLILG
jgi:hypothetical protein